jgi:antitoxin (DNA-binding transcriptional repressor) of toxin-antitoxin stability system
MRSVGLKTLNNKLREYVRLTAGGETVLVTDRDRVVAEIGPPQPHAELDALGRPIIKRLPAGVADAAGLGRARAARTQAGDETRRTSEQSAARSSRPMIYLGSSVALAHLLAEDRFPPDELWDQHSQRRSRGL